MNSTAQPNATPTPIWHMWGKGNEQQISSMGVNPNAKINNIDFNDKHLLIANPCDASNIEGNAIKSTRKVIAAASMMGYQIPK